MSSTYSLADDAGGRFAIDAARGVVTVADGSLIDYESARGPQLLDHRARQQRHVHLQPNFPHRRHECRPRNAD